MKIPKLPKFRFLILSILGFLPYGLQAETPEALDLKFSSAEAKAWKLDRKISEKPSLVFTDEGLQFTSEGFDSLNREWAVGSGPFEMSVDVTMTEGRTEQFSRNRGVVISLGTSREPGPEDTTILLAVTQTGLSLSAKKGGGRLGAERRPGVWYFPGQEIGGFLTTSMAGRGGQDFSVRWPTKTLGGTKVRMWVSRDASGAVHFKLFNADGAAAPWWEASLPDGLAGADFRWLTIHTGREAADFQDLSKFSLAAGQGNGPADGLITRLQARSLSGDKSVLDEPFPNAVLASKRAHRSLLLSPEQLKALRAKFHSPAFKDYKTVLLRTASSEVIEKLRMGQPDQNEAVYALTWALLLTQDKDAYLKPLLHHVDALIGPTDVYPSQATEYPGRLRQNLFIREFWVQNIAALALAYDLVGDELGEERRDRIRFLLTRMMNSYHSLLDDGDWWFGGNPSNTIGVGNGCLGVIAVVMKEDNPELSEKTISRALANIRKLFLGVDPDGGCIEGAMYWNYGLGYPMLFGWALRQTTGNDEALLASPQVKNATAYLAVNFGGDDKMIPFNDNQPWLVGWPVLAAAGREADSGLARWMADHMAATYAAGQPKPEQARSTYTVPAFLYRDEVPAPAEFPGLPNLATLESVQEGVLRSDGRQLLPRLVTGIKGKGPESTHHANEDQGSFVFYADGEMILLDPGYFEQSAREHSLPLIGDPTKMTLNPTTPAKLEGAWEKGDWRSLAVDATDAYNTSKKSPSVAERARRIFVQLGEKALVILDDTLPKEASLPITAQYQAGVPVTAEGSSATLEGKNGRVILQLFGPATTLNITPREFKKDWVFKQAGVPWNTLHATYTVDPERPLVSILRREAATKSAPKVTYAKDTITVELDGEPALTLKKSPDGWKAGQPTAF